MSTQSGINASKHLLDELNNRGDDGLVILGQIDDRSTEIEYRKEFRSVGQLQEYLELKPTKPCYLFIRDSDIWQFVSYTPDTAPVREKMLYASSKNTLLRQVGTNKIGRSVMVTEVHELAERPWAADESPKAYTEDELIKTEVDRKLNSEKNISGGRKLVSMSTGVAFKINEDELLSDLISNGTALIFEIDLTDEQIKLRTKKTPGSAKALVAAMDRDRPSYTLYQDEGRLFFIYTCPSGSKVKERMVYAANKQGFANYVNDSGFKISETFEVGDPEELELSALEPQSSQPAQEDSKPKFNRPKGPQRRSK
ncbi:ABR105Cp [Eremothecium gossypii ATCC 10895]|uniref:ABR105Cp n=1 Tax=Eremothecium gossypii (strain ATCC 10895 / CBS 109.51 / FGSC 9923 / NRRL Y-1056) TaxID=284811 RepID=Q75DC1_EREGS|nr:ABR105Cp [Eremothecium gossypii ATCC 10895]AAS50876.2 ABR105Cp [Eremothecium gossypii ATCC 10895]